MKHKIISKLLKLFAGIKSPAFSNIAEGTHAGSLTLTAAEDIDSPYLLVKIDDAGNAVEICTAADLPVGLALDECDMGEGVAVALPGCAESTFMCRAASDVDAGDEVFTAADGKVANTATGSCYKVGVAINAAQAGALVEVDPQGFGTRPNQIAESGMYVWQGSGAEETMTLAGAAEGDLAIASIAADGGTETAVVASVSEDSIKFKLNASGTAGSTKIAWVIIKR